MFDLENAKITVSKKFLASNEIAKEPYISCNLRLCVINSGQATWQIGDKLYTVKAGNIVILDNHQKRRFTTILQGEGIMLTIIDFEPSFIINTQFIGLFLRNDKFDCLISDNNDILKLSEEIYSEETNKSINHHLLIGAKLIEILALLERHYGISDSNAYKLNDKIYTALEYIKHNYTSDDISLSKVANHLHMSMYNFSKLFSQHMKMGFTQYVIQKRIHHAIHLLEKTDMTVLAIAIECGFNNAASFYKTFKKFTCKTPSHYRNLHDDFRV